MDDLIARGVVEAGSPLNPAEWGTKVPPDVSSARLASEPGVAGVFRSERLPQFMAVRLTRISLDSQPVVYVGNSQGEGLASPRYKKQGGIHAVLSHC